MCITFITRNNFYYKNKFLPKITFNVFRDNMWKGKSKQKRSKQRESKEKLLTFWRTNDRLNKRLVNQIASWKANNKKKYGKITSSGNNCCYYVAAHQRTNKTCKKIHFFLCQSNWIFAKNYTLLWQKNK